MKKSKNRVIYPRKGTVLEKLQFLDKNHFKTIWRVDHLMATLKKKNELELSKTIKKELDRLSDEGVLFKISLRKRPLDTYYTFDVHWEFEDGVPIGKIHKPRHKDFISEVSKCRSWHIYFSEPPSTFKYKDCGRVRCEFING